MKKILSIFLLAVLIAAMIPSAWADNTDTFTIDERTVFNDMSRSYLQGYEPVISWDRLTMVIPIRAAEHERQNAAGGGWPLGSTLQSQPVL